MLTFTLAQLNYTVGDINGNVQKMMAAARQAQDEAASLVVFSELSLTGYYPGDLLDDPSFLQRVDDGLTTLLQASRQCPQLHWVVGAPCRHPGPGKPLHNTLLVLKAGQVVLRYAKQLLPTYNIFDERRHFEPGPDVAQVLRVGTARVGLMICEDGWNDEGTQYPTNPFERLRDAAPDLVISLNASPSHLGKRAQRHQVFAQASRRHGLPIVCVNQIGGQDQLVYDGASFAIEPHKGVVFEGLQFAEDVRTLRFEHGSFLTRTGEQPPCPAAQSLAPPPFYQRQIVLGLQDYARRCGFTQAVVGSSGGIDSAVTLALAAQALGPDKVVAVTMPSAVSSAGSVDDSAQLCHNLGVTLKTHPIAALVDSHRAQFDPSFGQALAGLTLENLQARIRGTVLMSYSNTFGHLVLTTGNKSELSVGYCTLYGDTNGGLGLIGDLYKTEVYALAQHLNSEAGRSLIPQAILDKAPSAELAPGQRDTDSLPPYPVLDEILKLLIEGQGLSDVETDQASAVVNVLMESAEGQALVAKVEKMVTRNEYKRRQAPPILRVRARAFGAGRQMPIAAMH